MSMAFQSLEQRSIMSTQNTFLFFFKAFLISKFEMLDLASGFIQLGLLNLENIRILGAWFPKEDRFWSIHCFFFSFCNSCNPLGGPLKNLWNSFVVTSGDWRKLLLSHGRLATLPSLTLQRERGPPVCLVHICLPF